MKIVLHGKLARLFGKEHNIEAATPADAIEGLSRQLDAWPREMLIDVVGFQTKESLFEITSAKEIHLVPSVSGGGAVGKILIGAALIALAIINPFGFSAMVAAAILSIGVTLALSGIMQLFMKAPTIDKSEDPPPSKYFGVDRNTTEIGTYRTMAYGRVQISGHWLSLQVDAKSLVKGRFPVSL